MLLATAVSLLASASGFGDEISKKTVLALTLGTEGLAVAESGEAELLEASFGREAERSVPEVGGE